ncbi:MAG: DMT family transporter [Actinomycetota bacterium]
MGRLSPNALGSLYMTLGSIGYVVNDAGIRRITDEGPGVYQALCMRSIVLVGVFAVVGHARGERTQRSHFTRPLLLRVAAEVGASALFFAAIVHLEFANAQAILQIAPVAVTLAAAVFLAERVSGAQYLAILLGFIGVLVVVRPATDGFSSWSLLVVASAALLVVREFATRSVDQRIPAVSVALVTAAGLAVLTAGLSAPGGWHALNGTTVAYLALSVGSLMVGYVFTIETVRVGELSVSAPFRYTVIVGAVVVGYMLFDEVPDRYTVIGSLVIIVSGLWSIRLDRPAPSPR